MLAAFEPEGFYYLTKDLREWVFIQKGPYTGWLARKHPDGYWVTMRIATEKDLDMIQRRIAMGN